NLRKILKVAKGNYNHTQGVIMKKDAFYHLLIKVLNELYTTELELTHALPEMAQAVTSQELKNAFESHLTETENQLDRLKQIFSSLEENIEEGQGEVITSLVNEGKEIIDSNFPDYVKDAALIAAAQCIEHYEIAQYGTARTFAKELELDDIVDLLQESLNE